jgi:UDP-N-acetylenolpyruvoylglucosamine reductase
VHANFIVNRGHATSADIIALVKQVRARVKAAHGVDLEPEVLLYGAEWRDVL